MIRFRSCKNRNRDRNSHFIVCLKMMIMTTSYLVSRQITVESSFKCVKEFVRNLTENANITYAIFRNILVNTLVCNERLLVKFTLKKKLKQKQFIHRIFPA